MNARASMRDVMPDTADWIDAKRAQWGRAYVDECLARAMAGEAGFFYAMERGHVVGTPWAMDKLPALAGGKAPRTVAEAQRLALMLGGSFAVFMRQPVSGGADGAN